jgi:hypothetical protein
MFVSIFFLFVEIILTIFGRNRSSAPAATRCLIVENPDDELRDDGQHVLDHVQRRCAFVQQVKGRVPRVAPGRPYPVA